MSVCSQFPMGPGPDGPMGGMGSMEPHHMNGSLGERATMPSSSTSGTRCISCIEAPPGECVVSCSYFFVFLFFVGSGDMDGLPKVNNFH